MKRLLVRLFLAVLSVLPMAAIILPVPTEAQEMALTYPVLETKDTQYFMSTFPTGLRYSKGWFGTFSYCPPVDEILLFDDDRGICVFRTKPGLEPKGAQGGTTLEKIDVKRANEIIKSYSLEESVKPIDPQIKEVMPHDAYFMGVWSGAKLAEKFDSNQAEIKSEIDVTGKEVKTVNGKPLSGKQKTALQLYDTAIANKEPFDLAKYDPDRYFVMGQVFIQNGSGVITEVGRNIADADLNVTTEGTFTFYMANGTSCVLTDNGDGAAITGSPKTLAAGSNAVTITGTGTIDFNITIGTTANWNSVNSWSAASGGQCTASVPTSADATKFDANSFSAAGQTSTVNADSSCLSMDWTGATNTPTLAGGEPLRFYGNVTFIAGMASTYTGVFVCMSNHTLTSAGINFSTAKWYLSAQLTLADALTIGTLYMRTGGILVTSNYDITMATVNSLGTPVGTMNLGSSAITVSTAWDLSVNTPNINAGTSIVKVTGTGVFAGGGKTYYEVQLNGTAHTISGSNIFTNLILKADTTQTITFTDGTNQTVTTPTFTGSAGKVKTLQGSGAAGWTVTKAGGGTVSYSYMSISRSTASPGTTWYVNDGTSTNGGNNTGWVWPVAPTLTTDAADDITATSVTLNGTITVTAPDSTVRGFEWDTNTGAPYANDWHEHGSYAAGAYDYALTPLTQGTEYFYRAYATNPAGTGYGAEAKFLTLPDPPAAFTITQLDLALRLDWTAGTGADTTYIRGKIGGYPANIADGNLIYSGAGITFTHTPLTYGNGWYYRMWSYVTIDGLSQYSATYAQDFETVTGTPLPPTNFILTQTGVNEITATWVAGFATTDTMIRYNTVSFPGSPTAQYLFYSGGLLTATITGVNLETNTYFFSAYGHNPTGYSVTANKKSIGGSSMALMGFIGLAVISTGLAYVLKNGVLKWIGAGGWVILGWYAFTLSTAGWDLYYSFGFLSVFVAIAVAFEYTYGEYQEHKQTKVNVNIDMENYRKEYMGQREVLDSMRTTSGVSRRRAHVAGTSDEERILKKSQNLFTQKLEEKYGKSKKRR